MIVGAQNAFVEFTLIESTPEGRSRSGDIAISVFARHGEFQGRVSPIWFEPDQVASFLAELRTLDGKRQGSSILKNMSSLSDYDPFRFEVRALGALGHIVVCSELLRLN